jgi:ATP-dependent RNA helicase DDX31/DBP7
MDRKSHDSTVSKIFTQQVFSQYNLHPHLVDLLQKPVDSGGFGISTCTTVQSFTIPAALDYKQNLLLKSQTGSGKTLAYLIPVINELVLLSQEWDRNDGTRALVVAPTRELCSQIADVLNKLTKCCVRIVGGSISGGEKKKSEKARLRKGVVVLVGTPGRLLDHVRTTESFNMTKLRWIVLDEIDRLLDMGKFFPSLSQSIYLI